MKGGFQMPTNNPRFSITLSDDLYKAVDDYKFAHRCKNQTQAIVQLLTAGLAELAQTPAAPQQIQPEPSIQLTDTEQKLLDDFRALNRQGRQYILQTMAMASQIYKNGSVPDMENRA